MNEPKHRSPFVLVGRLIVLVKPMLPIMLAAIVMGVAGYFCATFITIFGGFGILRALGLASPLRSVGVAFACILVFALLRGILRYAEQASNHYIAFKLLAVIRDKIFKALRVLCPAKLESKQKGAIIAMLTADIETLEVFYAHTISPICIAALVSLVVLLFVGFYASWYLALAALAGFLVIGILLPLVSSGKLRPSGVAYRKKFAAFNGYFLDSVKGVKDIVLNNAGPARAAEVDRRSEELQRQTTLSRHASSMAAGATELCVSLCILLSLLAGVGLYLGGQLSLGRMIVGHFRLLRAGHRHLRSAVQLDPDLRQRRPSAGPAG